jgi:A/G-specific adenine glycosylase
VAHSLLDRRRAFQSALLSWYRANARRLPWRDEPSLYRTVVSEFMLQQTQVKTVLPYFARWQEALPDFTALAAAPEEQVLKLWEGLGYYSRARNLHRLARALVALPAPPQTSAAWQELPGVGPYTAAAVTSISFGTPVACVDGNVVRILARLTGDATPYRDSSAAAKALAPLAQSLLAPSNPGDHNQAMMELGATVCSRQNPSCHACPVRRFCSAAHHGRPERFPVLAARVLEKRAITRVWCEAKGSLLLHRMPADARRLANLHELPTTAQAGVDDRALAAGAVLATRRRGITRYLITETIVVPAHFRSNTRTSSDLVWVSLGDLETITLSGPHRRWIGEILAARLPQPPKR